MKTTVAFAALLTCIFFQPFTSFGQCLIYPVSFEQRVSRSASIVQGKVTEKHTYLDESGNVYTRNTIKVNAWLKGHTSKDEIQVITYGGVYEDRATVVYPSLQLNENSEYIFFLDADNFKKDDKAARSLRPSIVQATVYSDMQGAIKNEGNNYKDYFSKSPITESTIFSRITNLAHSRVLTPSGKEFNARRPASVSNTKAILSVTSFSPSTVNGGTILPGDQITITGSSFGASAGSVFFTNVDDGGATYTSSGVASDIVSWSDNSITVKVPSGAGTGPIIVSTVSSGNMVSGTSLTVGYTHLEINSAFLNFAQITRQRYYFRNLNGSGGYTFLFNTSFNSNTAAFNSFSRAMATWRNSTGINFITGGTTSVATQANDGVNAVFFDATLPAGILGEAQTSFRGSGFSPTCDQSNTVWWASDIDVRFAPDPPVAGYPWQYGPALATGTSIDFESIAVHELGHAAGLGHRMAPGQVMNWNISNGMNVRTPSTIEKDGVTAKLSYSTSPTCFNPTTPYNSGSPMVLAATTLPVEFISFNGERKNTSTDILDWSVGQVTGNAGYAIERSADGIRFNQVGFVPETSTSEDQKSYTFNDNNAGAYPWYYRLKQVDINGSYTFSKTIFIRGDKNSSMRVFASEDGNTIHVYGSLSDNIAAFQLVTSTGQEIIRKVINKQVTDIPVTNLSKGIYYYRVIDNTNKVTSSGSLLLGK